MSDPNIGMHGRRLYGKYRGKVIENIDPLLLGRLLAEVPALPTSVLNWAMPAAPYAGAHVGFYTIPPLGANVWIEFEEGDPNRPIWSGCFWGEGEVPLEAPPLLKVFKTQWITMVLNDTPGAGGFTVECVPPAVNVTMSLLYTPEGITFSCPAAVITMTEETISITVPEAVVTMSSESIEISVPESSVTLTAETITATVPPAVVTIAAEDISMEAPDINMTANVNVTGPVEIKGAVDITGAVEITGDTDITGLFDVKGETNLTGLVTIEGETNIGGLLSVELETNIVGELSVEGNVTVAGVIFGVVVPPI